VVGFPVLCRIVDVRRPLGELYFVDASEDNTEDPGEELGDRWQLIYIDGATYEETRESIEATRA